MRAYASNGHMYRQVLRMEKKVMWAAREFGKEMARLQYYIWQDDPSKPAPRRGFRALMATLELELSEQGREAS